MNRYVFQMTARQVLGRKRTLLMGLIAALPILLAVVFQISPGDESKQDFTANAVEAGLVLAVVLPFVSLVFATAVLGAEIDDGTIVYLLSKPEARWRIVTTTLLVAFLATAVLVAGSALVAGAIGVAGEPQAGILPGFALAAVFGAFAYCCLFQLLSVLTGRALIAGLVYVFVWEGLVTGLFEGTRTFSVRECVYAIADAIAGTKDYEASVGVFPSIIVVTALAALAVLLSVRRLRRFELSERT